LPLRKLIAGISLALLIFIPVSLVHAQTSAELSASTNKQSYEPGDKVIITGNVQQPTDKNPVTIIVRNPIGNVYEVGQVTLMNSIFVHDFVLSNDAQGGIYTVNMRQGNETAQIQFQVITGQTQVIPVFDSEIRVSGKYTSLIKYGNVQISTSDNSITISIDASKIQNDSVTEQYHLPKHVIDTTSEQLIVQENGHDVSCTQTNSDVERVLDCPVSQGTKEITVVGTSVIPEFGTITTSILAMGVVVIIALSQKRPLFKFR